MLSLAVLLPSLLMSVQEVEPGSGILRADGWLVIESVDGRGRRPFRPNAVFAEFLAQGAEGFPAAGQRHTGESGAGEWKWVEAKDSGGPAEGGGWAAALVDVPPGAGGVYRARLQGGWELYVNGRALVGDAYRYGFGGVPVLLEEGLAQVMVSGTRGNFSLEFVPVEGPVEFETRDLTRPDLVVGEGGSVELGVTLHRTSTEPLAGARLLIGGALEGEVSLLPLAPLETRTVAVTASLREAASTAEAGTLEVTYRVVDAEGVRLASDSKNLRVVAPTSRRLRSFRSDIDGSTQVWGEVPPPVDEAEAVPGLVVSLHGASVAPRNQMGAYASEPGLWIVAPTNRRPYGFDWQDWGRTDAYEVRAEFMSRVAIDAARVYLTGHSMGGHGTWHLGANDPDGWVAIAPSAGWRTFDTYGGRPDGDLKELWHRADAASLTESLVENLVQLPTFVLHGDADSTVPAEEARAMLALLDEAGHVDLRSYFKEGAGHWWSGDNSKGADCVQWRGIFELFNEHRRELPTEEGSLVPSELSFMTVDPVVDSEHHWLSIEQVLEVGRPARVAARAVDDRIEIETENVRHLTLAPEASALRVVVDGQEQPARVAATSTAADEGEAPSPIGLVHEAGDWDVAADRPSVDERSPRRSGPFKRAFDREFVLVRGTAGTAEETAMLLDLARRDAQGWWYRANGRAPILTDRELLARPDLAHRNVILYGNAETNAAWAEVLGEECPIQLRRGFARIGDEQHKGRDFAAMFCYPRRGSDVALAGVFADTGLAGARLHAVSGHFISGVGLPDYAFFSSAVLQSGDGGVAVTGFFDNAWKIDPNNRQP